MYLTTITSTRPETNFNYAKLQQKEHSPPGNFFDLANSLLKEEVNVNKLQIFYRPSFGRLPDKKDIKPEHLKLMRGDPDENSLIPVQYSADFISRLCTFISIFNPDQNRQFALFEPLGINGVTCWCYTKAQVCAVNRQHRPEMFIILSIRLDMIENIEKVTQQLNRREVFQRTRRERYALLTPREREILNLLAKGYNNPKIAEYLFISRHTVEQHRKNINRKIGTNSSREIFQYSEVFDFD